MNHNTFYIPIGSSCNPTWYLHKKSYRNMALPFDWTVTPIQSVLELLNNDFTDFFDKDNLIYLPQTQRLLFKNDTDKPELTDDIITPVYDKRYHILYVHDFSKNGKIEYEKVKEKYFRRVERLRNILKNKNNYIYFIYDNNRPNEWQQQQYSKIGYTFIELSKSSIDNLTIDRNKTSFISLDDFINSKELKR